MRWRPRTCPSIRRSLFVFAALMRGSTLTALRPLRVSHPHAADPFRIPAPLIRYTPYGYRILRDVAGQVFRDNPTRKRPAASSMATRHAVQKLGRPSVIGGLRPESVGRIFLWVQ